MDDKSYRQRLLQRSLSRRRVLNGAALGSTGLATTMLLSCRAEKPAVTPETEVPRRGGSFRYPVGSIGHLDIMTTTIIHIWDVVGAIHHHLLKLSPVEHTVIPDLATLEQPDELTFVFKIPRGVRFHDKPPVNGRELTARDVVFSLDRIRSPEPVFIHRSDYRAIDKIEASDDSTIRISTRFVDASLLTTLASPQTIIIAPETVERFGDLRTAEAQIGTGPFLLQTFERSTGARLVRHPQYYKEGRPYLDSIEIAIVPAVSQAWNMFLAGQLDQSEVPREEVAGFDPQAKGLISARNSNCGGSAALGWTLNLQRKPLDDVRVRRALSLLIDRRETLQNGYPGFPTALSRISVALGWDHDFYNLSIEETEKLPWGWDPKKRAEDIRQGIQLLEAAGITRNNPLRIEIIGSDSPDSVHGIITGEYVKGYMERVTEGRVLLGPLRYMAIAAWRERSARGEFDAEFSHNCVGFDVDHPLSRMHASDGGRNYGRWRDPEIDRLLAKERSLLDRNQRKATVHEALRYIADQVPHVWIGYGVAPAVVKRTIRNYLPRQGPEQLDETWLAG